MLIYSAYARSMMYLSGEKVRVCAFPCKIVAIFQSVYSAFIWFLLYFCND